MTTACSSTSTSASSESARVPCRRLTYVSCLTKIKTSCARFECSSSLPLHYNGYEPSTHKISLLPRLKTQRPRLCDIAFSQLLLNTVQIHAGKTGHGLVHQAVGTPKHGLVVYKEHV